MKVGFIAVLGLPNAGKSTLINAMLSKKVSIVSHKAQTTRDNILGILNEKGYQFVFIDTPGIYMGKEKLDQHMRHEAYSSSRDAEVVLYLIDASNKELEKDFTIIKGLRSESKLFILLNKIDLIRPDEAISIKERIKSELPGYELIETSFLKNFGIKEVKEAIKPYLIESEPFYPDDMFTDKDHAYQCKEIIREKMLHFLNKEIPHQSAVKIDSLAKEDGGYLIKATIGVEKENHKAIVIGKAGSMIKKISMASRHELEKMWHEHITSLEVKVEYVPNWRNNPKLLMEFGYGDKR